MSKSAGGQSTLITGRLRGAWEWISSIRHWELLVLMLVAAAVLLGYFVGALLLIYRLFAFVSLEMFVGLAVVSVIIGTWGTTKWEMRKVRQEVSPLPRSDAPQLHRHVEIMSADLGIAEPELYVIGDGAVNAFALGTRWDGMVVIHSGLFEVLDDEDEMAAIVAHELAHLYYCDSFLTGAGQEFERFIRKVSRVTVTAVLTIVTFGVLWATRQKAEAVRMRRKIESIPAVPISVSQNALSRYREFVADSTSAALLGGADPMISALTKLENTDTESTDRLSPVNPVDRSRRLLRTHPSIDRRQTLLRDDFKRERAGFVPFYEGATLGTVTKFGLTVAPLFVIALFVAGLVQTSELTIGQRFANANPALGAAVVLFFLLWFLSLIAFPWAMLFASGGRPVYGLGFLACLALTFFTGAVERIFPAVADIDLIAPAGYIGMTLITVVYLGDAVRVRIQRIEGPLVTSVGRAGQSTLQTIATGVLTAHLSIANSRLLQACVLLTAILLYVAENPLSWALGVYLLLTVVTDGS